jgi:hypothetical protein
MVRWAFLQKRRGSPGHSLVGGRGRGVSMSLMLVVVLVLELRGWVVVDGKLGAVEVRERRRWVLWLVETRTVEGNMQLV